MLLIRTGLIIALFVGLLLTPREAAAQGAFEGWHLEPGVAQAHLVMVARVASVGELRVVEGAKTDVALREYRFQPVRRLKGIFQRDELAMTGGDLGLVSEDASQPAPLQEGEFRLLILVQQQGLESMGCVSASPGATTFDERVPRLNGPDDPLVAVVDTLIRVTDSRSRRERATLLIDGLMQAEGIAATPLLSSLRLRANWAAADPRAYAALARLARDSQLAVRRAALETLRDVLASGVRPQDPQLLEPVAEALRQVFDAKEAITQLRVTALEALGHLLAIEPSMGWSRELLIAELSGAATYAERGAAATALAQLDDPAAATALVEALGKLPLDESSAREAVYANAALKRDVPAAERALLTRLERSIAARQSLAGEIAPLGRTRNLECLPLLLAAAKLANSDYDDRRDIAWALGRLGDDRGVPVLMGWLRGDDYHLKESALAALETLDSELAAGEVRTLLKSESHLPFKLRMARLMARHGIADGYALATEHLADAGRTPEAALVLAALDDPRAAHDLSAIVAARPDRRWLAAALAGLTAIGDASGRKQVVEILSDDRHPLAADAAEAAGLAESNELLLPLTRLAKSRNSRLALTSLVALRRSMLGVRGAPRGLAAADAAENTSDASASQPAADFPAETRIAMSEAVASLMVDAYVAADVRNEAFAVAKLLGGPRYVEVLSTVADQAELEGTQLLYDVEAELRRGRTP